MTGGYGMGSHIDTTYLTLSGPSSSVYGSGGTYASAELPVVEGTFSVSACFDSFCTDSNTSYGGGCASAQVTTTCPDTCTACQALYGTQTGTCNINLVQCEAAAGTAFAAAMLACENNAFCQSGNPNFNQEECDRCKNTVTGIYAAAAATCGVLWYQCRDNRVNCTLSIYKTATCGSCSNP
jgi:hypothetical protein